jgi:hypothetical protein
VETFPAFEAGGYYKRKTCQLLKRSGAPLKLEVKEADWKQNVPSGLKKAAILLVDGHAPGRLSAQVDQVSG